MESINQSSSEADKFIGLINDIAFQTSILSMNATIEAARAGEQGKGFAVVAQEVRTLSVRTAEASKSIKELIEKSVSLSKFGKQVAQEADNKIVQISDNIQAYSERINSISETAQEQTQGIKKVNDAIQKLDHITRSNNELIAELAINTKHLDRQAGDLKDAAMVFQLPNSQFSHDLHRLAYDVAKDTAHFVGQKFDNGVNRTLISEADLFSHEYSLIPKTDPIKHTSRFDGFTDNVLPEIQEAVLREYPEFTYAITADYNGYVPTHNSKFCQPLTGDYQQDLSGNRTKRVFSDRVGQLVGRNDEPFILQTYRRDTGELMFDMSVPIVVMGKHWGGFRIGYRIT